MRKPLDNRDPIAVFGVEAANTIVKTIEELLPHDRVRALEDELNSIDLSLFPALNARTAKMLVNDAALTDLDAVREALAPIFANYLKNTFIKLQQGDTTALDGLCGSCSAGYHAAGDIFGSIGKVFTTGATAIKSLACKVAPLASSVPDPRVAGGAAIANNLLCGGGGSGSSQADLIALQMQMEAQRRADQQRMLLLVGGGIAAVLLVVALK